MNEYYKKMLKQFLDLKMNICNYEQELCEKYNDLIIKDNLNRCYYLENQIYLDKLEDKDREYLNSIYTNNVSFNDDIYKFVERTFIKVVRYNLNKKMKIYYDGVNFDMNNFVEDGTLVWKINYVERISVDIKEQFKLIEELRMDVSRFDEEMSAILEAKVRTFLEPVVLN